MHPVDPHEDPLPSTELNMATERNMEARIATSEALLSEPSIGPLNFKEDNKRGIPLQNYSSRDSDLGDKPLQLKSDKTVGGVQINIHEDSAAPRRQLTR